MSETNGETKMNLAELIGQYGVQCSKTHELAPTMEFAEEIKRHFALEAEVAALRAEVEALREDAERWRTLPAFLEKHQINYVMLLADIDAARTEADRG